MKRILTTVVIAFVAATVATGAVTRAQAKSPRRVAAVKVAEKRPVSNQTAYRQNPYVGALSANAATGEILFEQGADKPAYPASVTKLMTLLLVLEDLEAGRYRLDTPVVATPDVYRTEPSIIGIRPGQSMSVNDLLLSLMVKSANDAAIALGVHASGSLDAFVARMNARAQELGMTKTKYYNPNGLPPKKKFGYVDFNVTTCRDQLKLALFLVKKPLVFKYTSVKVGEVKDGDGQPLRFVNHNNLMVKDKKKIFNPDGSEAVDGLKTGYIDAGGSSIVLTGKRKGKRAIVIVLGASSADLRDQNAGRLLQDALGALSW